MLKKRVLITAAGLALVLSACTGPEGPMGPQGLQGPQGAQGTTRLVLTALAPTGGVVTVALPAAAGTSPLQPPSVAGYMTIDPTSGVWDAVSDGFWIADTPWCGLSFYSGVWNASMYNVPTGWTAAFVIVY